MLTNSEPFPISQSLETVTFCPINLGDYETEHKLCLNMRGLSRAGSLYEKCLKMKFEEGGPVQVFSSETPYMLAYAAIVAGTVCLGGLSLYNGIPCIPVPKDETRDLGALDEKSSIRAAGVVRNLIAKPGRSPSATHVVVVGGSGTCIALAKALAELIESPQANSPHFERLGDEWAAISMQVETRELSFTSWGYLNHG